jgi:hypothetical protein
MEINGLVRKLLKAHAVQMGKEKIVFNARFTKVLFGAVGENGQKTTENWRSILSGHHPSLAGLSNEEISAVLALFIYSTVHSKTASADIRT